MKTHREILQILSGLLVAMFVANVSATVVANALPVMSAHLGTTQRQYTWIVTAALLAQTASTPIWGKLADLFDKKKLLMVSIGLFVLGSLAAGAVTNTAQLIAARALQGLGMGAMLILIQTIIGTVIPPRERGRYMAYTGAVIAVATVAGPLVGGFIVDQSWLGWRWCFWASVPFALGAMAILQWRLDIPKVRPAGKAAIDWLGAFLITAAASDLLIWISFADDSFAWLSWQTAVMLSTTVILVVLFILVERRAADPIIPLRIVRERNTALAITASIAVGIGMFGASVFLGQYYQLARGYSPTTAGLMMVPMMAGVLVSSIVIGRWVTRVGLWKPFVVVGSIILTGGFVLLATIDYETSLLVIGVYGAIAGLGLGMTMQNLVLAVQNSVSVRDVGAATASVNFFRSLGGAIGIQVMGSIFATRVTKLTTERLAQLGIHPGASGEGPASGGSLDLSAVPAPIAKVVRSAYGDSMGPLFAIGAAVAALSIIAVAFMRSTRLRDKFDLGSPPADDPDETASDDAEAAQVGLD